MKYPKPYPIIFIALLSAMMLAMCGRHNNNTAMEKLAPDNFLGWTAKDRVEQYDRETIFDYIDGAGEVYLLYGYRKALVKRYSKPNGQGIILEIFDMGSSADAYGIFSHSHERNDSLVGQGSDFHGSLLCFWKNRYYVCISAEKEDAETNEAILQLAQTIDRNIGPNGETPALLIYLPDDGLRANSIKYFHKYTSLNYHYYLSEMNLLNLNVTTEAVLAIYDPGRAHLLIVSYDNSGDARGAYDGFIEGYLPDAQEAGLAQLEGERWIYAITYENFVIAVFDVPSSELAKELVSDVKNRIAKKTYGGENQ
jgi:hypothetical protein